MAWANAARGFVEVKSVSGQLRNGALSSRMGSGGGVDGALIRRFGRGHEAVDVGVIVVAEAEEARVRGVLEQAAHEVGHAREEIADRRVEADAMAEIAQEVAFRLGHAVEHLKLERAGLEAELVCVGEDDGHGAQVVRAEGGVDCGAIVEQAADEALVIRVGVALLREDGAGVAV